MTERDQKRDKGKRQRRRDKRVFDTGRSKEEKEQETKKHTLDKDMPIIYLSINVLKSSCSEMEE